MLWWQVILFPFSILYDLITRFRNHLFNIGYSRSFQFQVNTICVGNLSVGGTGKSPMVELLATKFLEEGRSVTTLSRGYGRKTKGFILADEDSTSDEIGDEPAAFKNKLSGKGLEVVVCEDRALAIPQILFEKPETDLIILDDGLQHRRVQSDVNLLLTPYQRLFYDDWLMPSGRLREARVGANRADIIVVTKCPESEWKKNQSSIENRIKRYAPEARIFFSSVMFLEPQCFGNVKEMPDRFIAVSGLADNQPFLEKVASQYDIVETFGMSDHYHYKHSDVSTFQKFLDQGFGLITTEKDYIKLRSFDNLDATLCYYLPIRTRIMESEELFFDTIRQSLPRYPVNSVS